MINFKTDKGVFNFRVAGIMIKDNKVLIHRMTRDDFFTFPGGRTEMLESTEQTIIREMKEELCVDVKVKRFLWLYEHFFEYSDTPYHEICFYYLIECNDKKLFDRSETFMVREGGFEFEFKWVTIEEAATEKLFPEGIKKRLGNLPEQVERVVDYGR